MNKRIFVRKKSQFRVEEENLLEDLKNNLQEKKIENVELYNIYDCFNLKEGEEKTLVEKVLSEVVTDEIFYEIDLDKENNFFAMEFLPGQYDQRGESAKECLGFCGLGEDVKIKSGKLLILKGELKNLEKIKKYLINPLESMEKDLKVLKFQEDVTVEPMKTYENFINLSQEKLKEFLRENNLAMKFEDLKHIQNYFKEIEKRNPTECEIKVLDTYWSDHCRHSTFETQLEKIEIEEGLLKEEIEKSLEKYYSMRRELKRENKPVTLMDMGTIGGRYLKSLGKLEDMEVSEEINACSVKVTVDVDGKDEEWLLMFKNETHNHPTEIEPFGGASTCIGGAIRDPLSGRAYVYQGMRITGAGNILKPLGETLENKLPQRVISKEATQGFSSYGNQIGMATTYVKEIYHQGYEAKRMEVGAVVGAVKKSHVKREVPKPGDIVVLIGGKTGRDGIGGATGSSKEQNEHSLKKSSSEVQRGNAPMERKLQRLFRNPKVTKLIKRANDFGAGGVSVAIGEIARGVEIDLDKVPKKYAGLNGVELAISESQERMAVVIEKKFWEEFKELAHGENLQAVVVAKVTQEPRLVMTYGKEKIVDISREFLDTNGIRDIKRASIITEVSENIFKRDYQGTSQELLEKLEDLNVCSQRGMVERFDSTIGRGTVIMPYGGKYQLSPSEGGVQKLPVDGFTKTSSILTFGFNPYISEKSTYLGGIYAVIESLSKIVALGGDYRRARLSFQEYFEKLGEDEKKWGKVAGALLGTIEAQRHFETPAIGGKDSMSGTYGNISVPPTLISFGVVTENCDNIISSEFKEKESYIYLIDLPRDSKNIPNYSKVKKIYEEIRENILNRKIISASTVAQGGIWEAVVKMSLGNMIGFKLEDRGDLLDLKPGSLIVEAREKLSFGELLGRTVENGAHGEVGDKVFTLKKLKKTNEKTLENIYPYVSENIGSVEGIENKKFLKRKARKLYEKPKVLIIVFPGSNCEYDSKKAFEKAGGEVEIFVFNNLNEKEVEKSVERLYRKILKAQILMLPGGFSGGDEPDGSGKFIGNLLQNPDIKEAIEEFLKRDGLILGICNGFQGLIKCGLLPYGNFNEIGENSPTLFRNNINRHVSRMTNTVIKNNRSPWLSSFEVGEVHKMPMSHGEGKFVASREVIEDLYRNNQVVTEYCDFNGNSTMDGEFNINGSVSAIEGIISPCGQIFGKMGHSERYEEGLFKNIPGNKLQDIFKNGIEFFKK